uniref:purine-nucleoside phosphorylase n=1 Tax=Angiostrongylus cantonensis TaxID=6313 RepID=A0A0K0DQS5_ANGCA
MSNVNSPHKPINNSEVHFYTCLRLRAVSAFIHSPRSYDDLLAVVASIKNQIGDKALAKVGIICGSGLGPIGDQVEEPTVLPYEKIPGFPSVSEGDFYLQTEYFISSLLANLLIEISDFLNLLRIRIDSERITVVGHKGNLIFGKIAGKSVVCMQGRFHPYEHNMDLALCAFPVRVMHQLGVERMIVSNAAGGINPEFTYGDLMLIKMKGFLNMLRLP